MKSPAVFTAEALENRAEMRNCWILHHLLRGIFADSSVPLFRMVHQFEDAWEASGKPSFRYLPEIRREAKSVRKGEKEEGRKKYFQSAASRITSILKFLLLGLSKIKKSIK